MPAVRRALDAGTLDMGEVQTILHTLLSVGGESTTSLLGNAVRMLAEDPALQQRLRARPEDIDVFVEEAWPSGTASISASEPRAESRPRQSKTRMLRRPIPAQRHDRAAKPEHQRGGPCGGCRK
jgi:cytochrome P450